MAPPAASRLPVLLLLASLVLTHCLTVSAGVESLHAKSQIKVSDDDDLEAPTPAGGPSVAPTLSIDCGHECGRRCSEASRQDRCLKYCNICCSKCQCVPPGTYGNKEVCPCYANLKNSKGTSKCP